MKKILSILILASLSIGLIVPVLVSAQELKSQACCELSRDIKIGELMFLKGATVGEKDGLCKKATLYPGVIKVKCSGNKKDEVLGSAECYTKEWGMLCLFNTVYSATNWFFYILIIISVIMIIYGGFSILFATGDPDKMKKGRGVIVYAIVGIAVALFAKVIPSIVRFIMGL